MGLYVSFTPSDLGFPLTLSQMVMGEYVSVSVDYMKACQAFVDTFMATATSLVPVDTGYLQSTISARTDGAECEAEATADYAQYVEYGTWKMRAQPYFEPAVEEGLKAFGILAEEARSEAQEELQDLCEAVVDAAAETFGDGSFLGDIGGMLMGMAMLWLMFPLLVNLYGILDTLHPGDHNFNEGIAGTKVEVIIT